MNTPQHAPRLPASRLVQLLVQWIAFLLPVVLVLSAALGPFRDAVIRSIASTPHPELVYAILAVFFTGVLLAGATLWRYSREGDLAQTWTGTGLAHRQGLIDRQAPSAFLFPLLKLLQSNRAVPPNVHQALIDQEVSALSARVEDRLVLPQYLAGALVGLGLVGTFVGLLGTLEDLGKLFGALAATDGSAAANPADLFADMVRRLQEPMRGMGTAFVASLYGLLGSLILGLQILVVGKVGHQLVQHALDIVRQADEQKAASHFGLGQLPVVDAEAEARHINGQHEQFMQLVLATLSEQARLWRELGSDLREQHTRSLQENQALRREVLTVAQTSQALVDAVQQSTAADERYRASVPRTSYWQDAWVKVQAYLQRSQTDQALAEVLRTGRAQEHALERVAASLAGIEQRIKAQWELRLNEPNDRS